MTMTAVLALAPAPALAGQGGARPDTAGTISTVAGGAGGPALATKVSLTPCGVSFAAGHLLVAGNRAVRRVGTGTGQLSTPAGTGVVSPLSDRGPAVSAGLQTCGVAADAVGNLVIADFQNQRIRVVAASTGTFYGQAMTAGDIYGVAGNGTAGFSGDGRPATGAELSFPGGVAVDSAGNLVIADTSNSRIRVVAESTGTFYGRAMTAGDIYTVAGNGTRGFSGDGIPATQAELYFPQGVVTDAAGNLVIADTTNGRVRVVAKSTGTFYGRAMTAGDIYTVAGGGKTEGDGGPATSALVHPQAVALDGTGNLVIADFQFQRVRVVAVSTGTFYGQAMTKGDIYTIAGNGQQGFSGDGEPATSATFANPDGVAVDAAGNVAISDSNNNRVRVVAESGGTFYGQAMTAGDIYTVAGHGAGLITSGVPALNVQLGSPRAATEDLEGNLLIADTGNSQIRVVAASTGTFYGRAMTAGDIYTVAGDGKRGFAGDGGPATSARIGPAFGVAADAAGNLVITGDQRLRVVAGSAGTFYGRAMTAGDIYTVAGGGTDPSGSGIPATTAQLGEPAGASVDGAGNLVFADDMTSLVRVVAVSTGTFYGRPMTAGDIYTVAGGGTAGLGDGGPATSAQLNTPENVVVDGAGNLVIADSANQRIRVVAIRGGTFYGRAMTAGDIYTVAGNGNVGFAGDGGLATKAQLDFPDGVALDGAGNLVIADTLNHRIRVAARTTSTFYGQPMTAGDIYTVAGDGTVGFSGDGAPAASAELNGPIGVAATSGGNLVIADTGSNRIRVVTGS